MSAFDPDKARYVDCEVVSHAYTSHPMSRNEFTASGVSFELYQAVQTLRDRKVFLIWVLVSGVVSVDDGTPIARCKTVFRSLFEVDNFDELVIVDDVEKINQIDTDTMAAFLSMTVSTARGQLQVLLGSTPFRNLSLPLLTIKDILTLPSFDIRESVSAWESAVIEEASE